MKLRNLMWGACACALMAGCSNDDIAVDNSSNIVQEDGNAYVRVRIAMGNGLGSRASEGEYAQGLVGEQEIKSIYFVFYDDNGKWVANGESVESTPVTEGSGNIDAISNAVVALQLPEGSAYPTQVVAYVNIPNAATLFGGKDLADVNTSDSSGEGEVTTGKGARGMAIENGDGTTVSSASTGFMMTNSTYLNNDGAEQIATPVERDNFFDNADAAKEANPVEIYVERLAAKVSITNSASPQDITNVGDYTLHFTVDGAALSGTNTQEYYLKHINPEWNAWTKTSSGDTEEVGKWHWNEPSDYRCFWAEDPNYTSNNASNGLAYLSYDEVPDNDGAATLYCMENTMEGSVAGDYTTTTHLLLVGTYSIKNSEDEDVPLTTNSSDGNLYMFGGTAYLSTDLINRLLTDIQETNPDKLAYVQGNVSGNISYSHATADAYELVKTSENALTTVTLRLKSNTGTTYYKYVSEDTYEAITTEGDSPNYDAFNTALADCVEGLGTIKGYNGGKAYFAMPIKHFGNAEDGTGTYGIVRNHSYQLTITTITGLGEGIFQPGIDIIPNDETATYYMAAKLNVLSWKTVGTQNVEFK